VNYLAADESADAAASIYGPNYARLREIKAIEGEFYLAGVRTRAA
jgi:Berberine and berberine like